MTTYVFPGQGSQTRGMGELLFVEFSDLVKQADTILGYSIGTLCLEDPHEQLNKTEFTQPALYIVNALSYLKKYNATKTKPDYIAGHSLGEYNALFAAGVFDFVTGLKLVQKRGQLMSQAVDGGMAAIVGLKSENIQTLLQENNLSNVVIANYNSYTQVVISGPKQSIQTAEPIFKHAGAKLYIPLKVSGAFHSPLMNPAQQQFSEFLAGFIFSEPSIPVIANINAKPYTFTNIHTHLANQINHSVQWTQSIEYILMQGETYFEEIGPGKVLAGLITRIQKGQ
ncbi:MAG: hypothetical protein ACD_45C00056G0013 [uncultured bacterium]|nr:MAG: hypothetical protein ACD_45C00056G0013 [uncultured bacterium]